MANKDEQKLVEFLYDEMSEAEARAYERSLSADERAELEGMSDALRMIRSVEDEEPPAHLDALIMAHAREVAEAESKPGWLSRLLGRPGLGLVLAGSCALFVAVITVPLMREKDAAEMQLPQVSALRTSAEGSVAQSPKEPSAEPEEEPPAPPLGATAGAAKPMEEPVSKQGAGGAASGDFGYGLAGERAQAEAPARRSRRPKAKARSLGKVASEGAAKGAAKEESWDLGGRAGGKDAPADSLGGVDLDGLSKRQARRDEAPSRSLEDREIPRADDKLSEKKSAQKPAPEPPQARPPRQSAAPAPAESPASPPAGATRGASGPAAREAAPEAEADASSLDEAAEEAKAPAKNDGAESESRRIADQAIREARAFLTKKQVSEARRVLVEARSRTLRSPEVYAELSLHLAQLELDQGRNAAAAAYARDAMRTRDPDRRRRAEAILERASTSK